MEGKNEIQDSVFKYISSGEYDKLVEVFKNNDLDANFVDKDGMTPLQHACYKGNEKISKFLIKKGADVTQTQHQCDYTALHFAALSGKTDLCLLLMSAGAKSHVTNSVGRTPSQLAAFVGNHNCVAIINNFIPRSDLECYTIPSGIEKEPKLPPPLLDKFYKFIMEINIHPIRLAIKMPKEFLDEFPKVKNVLELMSGKEMKKGSETNEVLSFKLHYLKCVLGEINKYRSTEKQSDPVESFARKILKGSRGEEYLEQFLRECLREFPFREGILFQQMVKSLAQKTDSPPALSVINSAINGQRGFCVDTSPCVTCSEPKANKKCSKCKIVRYCDRECQRLHWFVHKKECARDTTPKDDTEADEPKA